MRITDYDELDGYAALLTSCHRAFYLLKVKNHRLSWSCINLYPSEWNLIPSVGTFSAPARAGQMNRVFCSEGDNFLKPLEKTVSESHMLCKNSDQAAV